MASRSTGKRLVWCAERSDVSERRATVKYLRDCASYWREKATYLHRNPLAVGHAQAKATVLEGVADDIEHGRQHA